MSSTHLPLTTTATATAATTDASATAGTTSARPEAGAGQARHTRLMGVLPFIGVILFVANAVPTALDPGEGWRHELLLDAVVYLIGWAGVGAGIAHLLFARRTATSIGWSTSPFETEVGYADLAMGATALLAANHSTDYWFAVILVSSVFRIGCGVNHVRQIVTERDHALNNTSVLLIDFGVPAFLLLAYAAWA